MVRYNAFLHVFNYSSSKSTVGSGTYVRPFIIVMILFILMPRPASNLSDIFSWSTYTGSYSSYLSDEILMLARPVERGLHHGVRVEDEG